MQTQRSLSEKQLITYQRLRYCVIYCLVVKNDVLFFLIQLVMRICMSVSSQLSKQFLSLQCGHWGRVEWAHDLNQVDLQSRVAAAILFIHLNSATEHVTAKKKIVQQLIKNKIKLCRTVHSALFFILSLYFQLKY